MFCLYIHWLFFLNKISEISLLQSCNSVLCHQIYLLQMNTDAFTVFIMYMYYVCLFPEWPVMEEP